MESPKTSSDHRHCPLCHGGHCEPYHQDAHRRYFQCARCQLVFVPRRYWLSADEERAVYDLHENHADDAGYRKFLSRLSTPLLARLGARQQGLDFGCGPGPALPSMLEAHGHRVDRYDPFYFDDPSVFQKRYDFICATEVVEHLHHPAETFATLFGMLKTGGWLAVMTKLVTDVQAFGHWHYIRDLTHVCFFSRGTFGDVARRFNAEIQHFGSDVILLNKLSL